VSQALTLGFGQTTISSFRGSGVTHDFTSAMPAGSTYTRTGAATGLTAAGTLTAFAENAPQRTDRGLALEPAATNILINSVFANSGGNRPTSWDEGIITGVSAPVASTILNTAFSQSGTAQRAWFSQIVALLANSSYIYSVYVEATEGTPGSVAYGTTLPVGASSNVLVNPAVGRRTFTLTTSVLAGNGTIRTGLGASTNATGSITLSNPQFELGTVATSPILTTGATATRGLPVFTEPVPIGCSKAVLTYYDGTTSEATGLTPGDTFEYAEHAIAAGKGRFGVSELVSRRWAA
jgi:hypothetical protein